MGQKYEHLSQEERVEIYRWHTAGKSARWIGEALGRHHSAISRELRRNSKATKQWPGGYEPLRADGLAQRRRKRQGRFKLARQPKLRRFVRDKLAMGWSPEAIAGRLALVKSSMRISHEAIYRYVYFRSAQCDYWHRLLPQKKHRRGWLGKRGRSPVDHIQGRVSIAERPAYILKRRQPGHWETDIIGFSRTGQNLLVAQERSSRFIFIAKTASRHAAVIHRLLRGWFKALTGDLRRSLTQDNGTEFALHHRLCESLAIKTYFCDPHSPWQKGGIENINGRLRRSLPRSTDLATISHRQIIAIARRNNSIPRKCLGFRTSFEVFNAFSQPSRFKRESTRSDGQGRLVIHNFEADEANRRFFYFEATTRKPPWLDFLNNKIIAEARISFEAVSKSPNGTLLISVDDWLFAATFDRSAVSYLEKAGVRARLRH